MRALPVRRDPARVRRGRYRRSTTWSRCTALCPRDDGEVTARDGTRSGVRDRAQGHGRRPVRVLRTPSRLRNTARVVVSLRRFSLNDIATSAIATALLADHGAAAVGVTTTSSASAR